MSDHTACTDDRASADGDAAADYGIGADPDVVLQRDGRRGTDAFRALGSVNGMAREQARQTPGAMKAPAPM